MNALVSSTAVQRTPARLLASRLLAARLLAARLLASCLRVVPLLVAALVFTAVVGARAGHAQDAEIRVPASLSGSLDAETLDSVAVAIRALERNPDAPDADRAIQPLFQWLMGSPDVSVSVCGEVAGPFLTETSNPVRRRALLQHLLSTAAYKIENPDASVTDAKVSGLEAALGTYQALSDEGDGSDAIEALLQRQQDGTLRQYVEDGVKSCG